MLTIKKFNNISDNIYNALDKESYIFIEDGKEDEGKPYDAILVRSADLHEVDFPKNLLAIARAGIGTDNIPIDRCTEAGIVVFNTPGANANAVKELVICAMFLSGRKIVDSVNWVREQGEEGKPGIEERVEKIKKQFVGREVAGKTIGIIGLGAIGVIVANACVALDMDVMGYDPYLSVESALKLSRAVHLCKSKEELLKKSDFVTMHLHLTPETENTIGEPELKMMKKGSVVLNYARGGLVDEDAILAALDSGKLARYMTDFPDDKLAGHPNVLATTHLGASTPEAEENCARIAARELDNFIRYGKIKNSVNFPNCDLFYETGYRLCIINKNIKNMVGQVSTILADNEINIEHMLNSSRGDWAYTMIDLEEEPPKKVIEAIKRIDGVVRVRLVHNDN